MSKMTPYPSKYGDAVSEYFQSLVDENIIETFKVIPRPFKNHKDGKIEYSRMIELPFSKKMFNKLKKVGKVVLWTRTEVGDEGNDIYSMSYKYFVPIMIDGNRHMIITDMLVTDVPQKFIDKHNGLLLKEASIKSTVRWWRYKTTSNYLNTPQMQELLEDPLVTTHKFRVTEENKDQLYINFNDEIILYTDWTKMKRVGYGIINFKKVYSKSGKPYWCVI